ncbi:MAG: endonuclease/exonuclease/phosphatase family protein [Flavobacteriales bacterium]
MKSFYSLAIALLFCASGGALKAQIQLDNQFNDWTNQPHVTDTEGGPFTSVSIASNVDWLYLHVELLNEVALDENILPNDLHILLDLDDDVSTGVDYANQGLGVDLLINLADRQAIRYTNGSGIETFNEVGMRVSPTYSSKEFEIAFDRGLTQVVGPNVRIAWYDSDSQSGFPEGGVSHTLNENIAPWIPMSLDRPSGTLNRVAFWNMNGRMDQPNAQAAMERILQAVSPDIIGFSEVSDVSANEVANLLNEWIPVENGGAWNVVKDDWDLMVASKGEILSSYPYVNRQFPTLVEGNEEWGVPLLFTSSHLKCCGGASNEAQRQAEADEYMAFVRNAIDGEGALELAPNTPIIYGGDLNMVGLDNPIYTLVTGDISNESAHGPDFNPDWDGTTFTEWNLLQTDDPFDFTWMSSSMNSEWMPGKLDYLITSDASAELKGGFTLRTEEMGADRLAAFGLEASDALDASDHFIVVGDLGLGDFIGMAPDTDGDGVNDYEDNCLYAANPDQNDFNVDGIGDACSDSDGDGLSDSLEITVYGSDPESSDSDGDGVVDGLELCVCSDNNLCPGDLTNDAVITVADLLVLLGLFGAIC